MLWFVIGGLAVVGAGIYSWFYSKSDRKDIGEMVATCLLVFVCAGCIALLLNWVFMQEAERDTQRVERIVSENELFALRDNMLLEGVFFVAYGRTGNKRHYEYLVETDRGISYERISASDAYLRIIENTAPRVIEYLSESITTHRTSTERDPSVWISVFQRGDNEWETSPLFGAKSWKVIEVPAGSVVSDFAVDLD